MTKSERLRLLTLGLAAGDSLGSTSEFVDREEVPALYRQMKSSGWPFKQVGGGAFGWKPGEQTDDTDMALCLVRSFVRTGTFDGSDVAAEFVGWLNSSPPDVCNATRKGLSSVRSGTPWHEGGLKDFEQNHRSAANGSLMRNGVVAGIADSLDDAYQISLHQSLPTHYGPLPILCCCAQSYLLWELLDGRKPFGGDWLKEYRASFTTWLRTAPDAIIKAWLGNVELRVDEAWETLLEADWDADLFNPFEIEFAGADGYCLLTLQIAVWAAQWSSRGVAFPTPKGFPAEVFEKATGPMFLPIVAMIGHDADTYGAAAGPLIAAVHGSIPGILVQKLDAVGELAALTIE